MLILNMFRGFCMALADSVPGVSGGTIAFLLGFYDKFIGSLDALVSGTKEERKEALIFLVKLGIGWAIGMCSSVLVLSKLFESHIYILSSVFFGLTLFAIPVVAREEKDSLKGKYYNLIFWALGTALVVALTYMNGRVGTKDFEHVTVGLVIYVFIVAMIAISAMVLPGISGSTMLLCFGVYHSVFNAINEFLHFNFKYVPMLFVFGFGVIAGIVAVIKSVKRCLEKYRSQTVYTILGLMTGSLYAIIQGPTTLKHSPKPALSLSTFSIVAFIGGGVLLFLLELFRYLMEKNAAKEELKAAIEKID